MDERAEAERDPWVGRVGYENVPGVFGGRWSGLYIQRSGRIELYAYLYDPSLPERGRWELYLRLRMLSTFVHEVAHHEDYMRRVARGRWRADDEDKSEALAEASAAHWVRECVVPYLEEAYPDAVRDLDTWIQHHGGASIPLALLGDDWRWDSDGKAVPVYWGSAREAFETLVEAVQKGEELTSTRLQFARNLHYGKNYAEAISVIERVLGEEPANLEALTLQADIMEHLEEYERAESLARQVLEVDEKYVDAWMVLTDVYQARKDWTQVLAAATHGMASTEESRWEWLALLEDRARANLELQDYEGVAADLEMVPDSSPRIHIVAPLRALLLLRTGMYEKSLALADSYLARERIPPGHRAVLTAVRFEAARKLDRTAGAAELSSDVVRALRRLGHDEWADQLVADYPLQTG